MNISTINLRKQDIRDDIINKIILNEIDVLASINENVNSNNIANFYGISCEYNDDIITVYIIMEKFDYNLWTYAIKY